VFIGNLNTLPNIVETADVHAPTLVIVGEVVKLHKKLAWFGSLGQRPKSTEADRANE
jgi:uroporphyrin-III C-methyltransferase/precorrin-2 dehydrogenase/sirohydrochlorin ferrochelatase